MKKIILMLVIAFSFVACKKDNPNKFALVIESGESVGVTLELENGDKLSDFESCDDEVREYLTFKADKGEDIIITNNGSGVITYSIRVGDCGGNYNNKGGNLGGGKSINTSIE